ncbi:MAG: DNA helicase RecQ [Alphaproteobacteria bacterium]
MPIRATQDRNKRKAETLREIFGFDSFRPGQEAVVDAILAGRNVLMVMPTGAGKSLCYQVPSLVMGGLTIVVSPLVALMRDQVSALTLAGVAAAAINSSHSRAENIETWRRVQAGEIRLLYMAPERLMGAPMLAALGKLDLSLIAVDEAHCISQWGPAFRPEYADLARLGQIFPDVPLAALTATADEATRRDIKAKLFSGDGEIFVQGFDRPNISLGVEAKRQWKRQLLDFLHDHAGECGIVYCLSRKKTEDAAAYLAENGFAALPYHAGMDQTERQANQNAFMTQPGTIIVATIAFGMGIDKPDVRFVFHTDMPAGVEAYYQEIGRAGRDGEPAKAHMLYGLDDIRMRRVFIEQEESDSDRKRREHKRLDALIGYCESPECRRQALLAYFGDMVEPCGNCDICLNPMEMTDGTEEGQQILSAVDRTGQRFGAAHIIDVLRGADTEKIRQFGHHRLPTYGLGAARKKPQWQTLIRQLVAAGFLRLDINGYGGLSITERGQGLLGGEANFFYRQDLVPKGQTRSSPRAGPASAAEHTDLTADETALFARLKELRLSLARQRAVPAYVIFSDKSLIDMARHAPRTKDSFSGIHGVGQAKLRDFAEIFLGAIDEHCRPAI